MRKYIKQLNAINLESFPTEIINELLTHFGRLPMMVTEYHAGKIIYRASPITETEIVSNVNRLTYKPQILNTNYQRASTPENTMFYGSTISEDDEPTSIYNPRITSAMEVVPFLRNPLLEGEQRLIYSKWILTGTINLITVLFTKYRQSSNRWIKGLSEEFYTQIQDFPKDVQKNTKSFTNFLSSQFGRCVNEGENYKYLITALITKRFLNNEFDGVIYPSVRSINLGLNVAIKPSAVDQNLRLQSVLECKVYKRNNKVILNNIAFCNVPQGADTFELVQITDPTIRYTEEEIQTRLNQ